MDTSSQVVGWFSLSLIISGLAQAFNREWLLWWLFGIFTGPFALFWLVVSGKIKPEPVVSMTHRRTRIRRSTRPSKKVRRPPQT